MAPLKSPSAVGDCVEAEKPTAGRSKRSKRETAASLLNRTPLRQLLQHTPSWQGVLVLNYHRIGDPGKSPWNRELWSATADALESQVAHLARHTDLISPEDLSPSLDTPRGRHVMLTFDDGYRDNYELALPILRAHGAKALFFIVPGFIDNGTTAWWDEIAWMVHSSDVPAEGVLPFAQAKSFDGGDERVIRALVQRYKELPGAMTDSYLNGLAERLGTGRCPGRTDHWISWDMAREMRAAGMGIGGHTMTHPVLAQLPPEQQRAEVDACGRRLEEELKEPMRWFSYPVGSRASFTADTERIVEDAGVEIAFSFYGGLARLTAGRRMDVRRMHMGPHVTVPLLRATLGFPRIFARTE